jgi:hypothetical protein
VTAAAQPAPCTWLREQGLLAEEQAPADPTIAAALAQHLAGCPACARLHAEIGQLRGSLGRLTAPPPPDGWQRAVWRRIDAKQKTNLRVRWQKWAVGIAAPLAAAALILIVVQALRVRPAAVAVAPSEAIVLAYTFEPDPNRPRTRGGDVAVGDAVNFHAAAAGELPLATELRVYRDDAGIVLRCSTEPPCERRGKHLSARLVLSAIGRYRGMIVTAPGPLPAPSGFLDDDLAALAQTPGAVWRWANTIDIW